MIGGVTHVNYFLRDVFATAAELQSVCKYLLVDFSSNPETTDEKADVLKTGTL